MGAVLPSVRVTASNPPVMSCFYSKLIQLFVSSFRPLTSCRLARRDLLMMSYNTSFCLSLEVIAPSVFSVNIPNATSLCVDAREGVDIL